MAQIHFIFFPTCTAEALRKVGMLTSPVTSDCVVRERQPAWLGHLRIYQPDTIIIPVTYYEFYLLILLKSF